MEAWVVALNAFTAGFVLRDAISDVESGRYAWALFDLFFFMATGTVAILVAWS